MTEITEDLSERADVLTEAKPDYEPGDNLEYDGVVADYGEGDVQDLDDDLPPMDDTQAEPEYTAETPAQEVVAGMEGMGVKDFLGNTAMREEVRQGVDTEAYKETLNAVNGTARGLPPEKWGMHGRGHVEAEGDLLGVTKEYDPPAPRDRVPLLEKAIEASKDLPAEHSGTLKGLIVNATHVYNDGCGRTSRWAYLADTHGYDGSQADRELYERALSETDGREVVDLNPGHMDLPGAYAREQRAAIAHEQGYGGKMPTANSGGYGAAMVGEESVEFLDAHPDLPPVGRRVLHGVITDPYFGSNAIMDHLIKTGRTEDYVFTSSDGQRTVINMDKLAPELASADVKAIGKAHSGLKRAYVEDLIDTFTNPDRAEEAQRIVDFYRPKNN